MLLLEIKPSFEIGMLLESLAHLSDAKKAVNNVKTPYLLKQIELIAPRLIVALGRFAAASLLRTQAALGKLREEIHMYNNVPLIVTYHPAALLRNTQLKSDAWDDLKKIQMQLKSR